MDKQHKQEIVNKILNILWIIEDFEFEKSRELSLTITKLEEAKMWAKEIPED